VGAYSKDNLKRFAADIGLDTEQFNQCLDSGKYSDKVRQETLEGKQKGVRGTPTLLINGQLIEGGADYRRLSAAIEAELSKLKK